MMCFIQSSVRHNLTQHQDFKKVNERKHGGKWTMVQTEKSSHSQQTKPGEISALGLTTSRNIYFFP